MKAVQKVAHSFSRTTVVLAVISDRVISWAVFDYVAVLLMSLDAIIVAESLLEARRRKE